MRRPPGPTEYRIAVAHAAERIAVAGIGFTANLDRSPFRAQMHTCLSDDWFLGAFENVFRVLACYRLYSEGGLVLHSAAFTDGARGFLFSGALGCWKVHTLQPGRGAPSRDPERRAERGHALWPIIPASGDAICRRFRRGTQAASALPLDRPARLGACEGAISAVLLERRSSLAYRRLVPLCERRPALARWAHFPGGDAGRPSAPSRSLFLERHTVLECIGS